MSRSFILAQSSSNIQMCPDCVEARNVLVYGVPEYGERHQIIRKAKLRSADDPQASRLKAKTRFKL